MGMEKLPVTGSTVCAESTSSIPWFSGAPLMLSLPSFVRTTPGTRGSAALNFCSASGSVVNCRLLTVADPTATVSSRQFTTLPLAEQKFKAALPLVPGVVRTKDGKLNIKGAPENQGMLLVDSAQTVDPVTGSFSIPIPVDTIQTLNVSKAPYSAEYGGFSGGLTTIESRPPSGNWHYGVMDFLPGF